MFAGAFFVNFSNDGRNRLRLKTGAMMLAVERKNRILSILQEEKKVVVGELAAMFDVSEETIRRDLEKLEA